MKIPKISITYDTPETQAPAGAKQMTKAGEGKDSAATQRKFEMAAGELVSITEKDPNTVELKVMTQEGKEVVASADSGMSVTKRVKLTDLKPGEKLTLHYMIDEASKKSTALYVSTNETPQFTMPQQLLPQSIPPKPSIDKSKGESKKK